MLIDILRFIYLCEMRMGEELGDRWSIFDGALV